MEHRRSNERGFTLMELMVVIVIVAILAAVAVPLYINYVKDAQRTEAKGAIAAVISAEQVYFQANPTKGYANYPSEDPTEAIKVDLTDLHNWTVTVEADGTTGFTVTAENTNDTDLNVCCTYARGVDPVWKEGADCAAGS